MLTTLPACWFWKEPKICSLKSSGTLLCPLAKSVAFWKPWTSNPSEPRSQNMNHKFPQWVTGSHSTTSHSFFLTSSFPFLLEAQCHIKSLSQCIYSVLKDGMSSVQIITSKAGTLSVSSAGNPNALSGYQLLGSTMSVMTSWSHDHGSIPIPLSV